MGLTEENKPIVYIDFWFAANPESPDPRWQGRVSSFYCAPFSVGF